MSLDCQLFSVSYESYHLQQQIFQILFKIEQARQLYSNSKMNDSSSDSESHNSRKKEVRSRSRSRDKKVNVQNREKKVKIKIPDLSSYLYSFKKFTYLQTEKMNPDTIQKGYDKYRKDWEHKQNSDFIDQCRKDAWFNEKYNPDVLEMLEKEKRDTFKRNYVQFMTRLQEGYYNAIDLRVVDTDKIGTICQLSEEEEQQFSTSNFINNQTLDINLSGSIDITRSPYFGYNPDQFTIFIRAISKEISRLQIRSVVQNLEGYKGLTMSDPQRGANYIRNCWIEFDNDDNCSKAVLSLNGTMIKSQTLHVSRAYTKTKHVKVLKNYPSSRLQTDILALSRLITKLDVQIGIQNNTLLEKSFNTLQQKFDVLFTYLRKIHAFDYYTCTQYENERVLALRTGSVFLRTEADYVQLANMQTVFKKIQQNAESKCAQMTQVPEYTSLLREQIQRFIMQSEKQPIQGVWRCKFCDKKFKSCDFLVKHILSKHEDIKTQKSQGIMEKLYLKDPFKITKYTIRDESKVQKYYGGGFRRQKRKEVYRDFDEPEETVTVRGPSKPLVNFLDI